MNSRKRIFLVTSMSALFIAAIAVGPAYKSKLAVAPVRAAPPTPGVVFLQCTTAISGSGPASVKIGGEAVPNTVTVPGDTADCANVLQTYYAAGYHRQNWSINTMPAAGETPARLVQNWVLAINTPGPVTTQ